MRRKKVPGLPPVQEIQKYTCTWCGAEKPENKFFKCALEKDKYICSDCLKKKYDELCSTHEKMLAVMACCCYIDVCFDYDIFKSLKPDDGIGFYIRRLNLLQNQRPDDFVTGLLRGGLIQSATNHASDLSIKQELTNIIERLEDVRNGI